MAWIFPVVGDWVYSWLFGEKDDQGNVHHGLDIATMGITGLPIVAPEDMHIINSGWSDAGYGNYVMASDSSGLTLIFGHMVDRPIVEMGNDVKAGDTLGYVGSTGNSSGPHLHFEVRQNGTPIDPMPFLTDAQTPPDITPLPPDTPGNPNPPGATIPGLGDVSSTIKSLNDFVKWIGSINYKKIFGNVAVVTIGVVLLAIGLYALANQSIITAASNAIGNSLKQTIPPPQEEPIEK
jgi:hypothetical protein